MHPNPHRVDPSLIHAVRSGEEFAIRIKDFQGHIPARALKAFERLMRQGSSTHPPDPRLVALVSLVSSHFQGRTLEVVSGYRAYTPTQYTPHSNHNYGKALDFRIEGVTNEKLYEFCRTLHKAGCGYYPNSTFVHLDTRDIKAFWVDWSRPGEPPRYDQPGVAADEGTSDVPAHDPEHDPSSGASSTPTKLPSSDRGSTAQGEMPSAASVGTPPAPEGVKKNLGRNDPVGGH